MAYVYVDSNIHLYTYDMSEYISKSTIIKYRDNGLTEKSIQMYPDKRRINLQKIVRMPGHVYSSVKYRSTIKITTPVIIQYVVADTNRSI